MRAIHIIAGLDRSQGGPSYSVPRLCKALRDQGTDVHIHTICRPDTPREPFIEAHKSDFQHIPLLRQLRISSDLERSVRAEAVSPSVIHTHGLWLMPNVSAGKLADAAGCPLIVSPRGMLSKAALAFSARRKRVFWKCFQGPAYEKAAVWHATSASEAEDIRNFGIRSPIAIVPNGIDIPAGPDSGIPSERTSRVVIYLGRIHPKKGLPNLLAAWKHLADERPEWTLRIVGPDENGHRTELENIVTRSRTPRVIFDHPMYGADKTRAFRDADLFVLPTQNENFGIAVAESLANSIPAIVTRGAPWSALETERCGWWIEQGVEPLTTALRQATALGDKERHCMGKRGRLLVERDYNWENIAREMRALYEWVLGYGARPSLVHLD